MKKFLALCFALVLVFTMLPGAMATSETTGDDATVTISGPGDDPGDNPGDDPGDNPGDDPGDNPGDDPGDNPGDDPGDNPGDDPGDNPGDDPGDNPGDDPGLLPDSPFYFLKRFFENVKVWFTFNQERKTEALAELVDVRAAELAALEEKYGDEEPTEKQLAILQQAAQELETAAEGVFDRLIGDGEDLEDLELSEEGLDQLEAALIKLGEALERVANEEDPIEDEDPNEDENEGEPEEEEEEEEDEAHPKLEKYRQRIRHLERIRDRNPEACHNGLNRAIENAQRQMCRWAEKHGIELPEEEEEGNPDGPEVLPTVNEDRGNKGNKGNNGNNGNNGKGNKGNNGKGNNGK